MEEEGLLRPPSHSFTKSWSLMHVVWKGLVIGLGIGLLLTLAVAIYAGVLAAHKNNPTIIENNFPDQECPQGDSMRSLINSTNMYKANRDAVFREFDDCDNCTKSNAVLYLVGGTVQSRSQNGVAADFRQESNFWYVSGVELPGAAIALDLTTQESHLFVTFLTMQQALWEGKYMTPQQFQDKYSVTYVHDISNVSLVLQALNVERVYTLDGGVPPVGSWEVLPASSIINAARQVKNAYEINLMRLVAHSSSNAHNALMKNVRPGLYEYNLEALFSFEVGKCGCDRLAYASIVGAGSNGAILHYTDGLDEITEEDILLVDAGAEFYGYGTDITRTYPATSTFTPDQRLIYDMVLDAQTSSIEMLRPGQAWKNVTSNAVSVLLKGLMQNNFLVNGSEADLRPLVSTFYFHGLGHSVGLDVHDPWDYVLQPGVVLTIEPGLYFNRGLLDPARASSNSSHYNWPVIDKYLNFGGVRIEDTILITETGYEILSASAPKSIDAIEQLMSQQ